MAGCEEQDYKSMSDYSASSDIECEPPSKKRFAGAFKYRTKFSIEWKKTWSFISAVSGNKYKFHCNWCMKDLSCEHQGRADVKQHVETASHQKAAKSMATQSQLSLHSADPIREKVDIYSSYSC